MFNKILIANRGEIACRIIRTARSLGVRTVALFSDADRHAAHVAMADEAFYLGGSAPADSYLKGDAIIDIAKPVAPRRSTRVMVFCRKTPVLPQPVNGPISPLSVPRPIP